jgi:hypothetical protein
MHEVKALFLKEKMFYWLTICFVGASGWLVKKLKGNMVSATFVCELLF